MVCLKIFQIYTQIRPTKDLKNFLEVNNLKQDLEGINETLLIPLWVRAMEIKHLHPIVIDKTAIYRSFKI